MADSNDNIADSKDTEDSCGFADLGLTETLTRTVMDLGYEEPTPIQALAIPLLLAGGDLLGRAATGTGKTAAFALPLLQRLAELPADRRPRGLIVVPTRELAMQVAQAIHTYGKQQGASVLAVYGGASFGHQARALKRGVDVVVATPGRALDHLRRGTLVLDAVVEVVLDEADEMLDMGFQEDIEALLSAVPQQRRIAFFSATFPRHLRRVADRFLKDPKRVEVDPDDGEPGEVPRVRQVIYLVRRAHKEAALARVLDMETPDAALVFCRTRIAVDQLSDAMASRGYRAEALHGGLSQQQRDRVMDRLREKAADLVIATDVAARGIDIEHLSHVINFDLPTSPDQYIHRIGRTGRAGREGVAISLAEPRERRLLNSIEHRTGARLELQAVPSVADLRERRLDQVRDRVSEVALGGDLGPFQRAVEKLMEQLEISEIAAAALKALADEMSPDDDYSQEIPEVAGRGPRNGGKRQREQTRWGGQDSRADRPQRRPRSAGAGWTKVYIGAGRLLGVRPGDLFGAIVNETGLPRGAVGAIQITDRFSIVEVPEEHADRVIAAMRATKLRGRRVDVRRDHGN